VTPDKEEDDLVSMINDGGFDSSVKWRLESSRKLAVLTTSKKIGLNWLRRALMNSEQLLSYKSFIS